MPLPLPTDLNLLFVWLIILLANSCFLSQILCFIFVVYSYPLDLPWHVPGALLVSILPCIMPLPLVYKFYEVCTVFQYIWELL